jgi:hypothetical protein
MPLSGDACFPGLTAVSRHIAGKLHVALIGLTVRAYRRCDEFIRLRILQAAALAAIVVAVFSLVYFFLELLGLPHLSTAWISNVVWAVFVVTMLRLIAMVK